MGISTTLSPRAIGDGGIAGSPRIARRLRWLQTLRRLFTRRSNHILRDLAELHAMANRCERHSPNLANELRFFATRVADEPNASPHRMGVPHR